MRSVHVEGLQNGTVSKTGSVEGNGVRSRLDCVQTTGIKTVLKYEAGHGNTVGERAGEQVKGNHGVEQ